MAIPHRGVTSHSTYFLTAGTFNKMRLLQSQRMAELFCEMLFRYRDAGKLRLHAFVVMPNHIHLLRTVPDGQTLERTMQYVKRGFSYEAGKRFGIHGPLWQKSYVDRRVRDALECERYRGYIHQNPVRAGLVGTAEEFAYSSMNQALLLDELPQRLKPEVLTTPVMHR
jgi:putative transposase